jgi:hypothetical protein
LVLTAAVRLRCLARKAVIASACCSIHSGPALPGVSMCCGARRPCRPLGDFMVGCALVVMTAEREGWGEAKEGKHTKKREARHAPTRQLGQTSWAFARAPLPLPPHHAPTTA